jgi:hypothetical protein
VTSFAKSKNATVDGGAECDLFHRSDILDRLKGRDGGNVLHAPHIQQKIAVENREYFFLYSTKRVRLMENYFATEKNRESDY